MREVGEEELKETREEELKETRTYLFRGRRRERKTLDIRGRCIEARCFFIKHGKRMRSRTQWEDFAFTRRAISSSKRMEEGEGT